MAHAACNARVLAIVCPVAASHALSRLLAMDCTRVCRERWSHLVPQVATIAAAALLLCTGSLSPQFNMFLHIAHPGRVCIPTLNVNIRQVVRGISHDTTYQNCAWLAVRLRCARVTLKNPGFIACMQVSPHRLHHSSVSCFFCYFLVFHTNRILSACTGVAHCTPSWGGVRSRLSVQYIPIPGVCSLFPYFHSVCSLSVFSFFIFPSFQGTFSTVLIHTCTRVYMFV